MTSFLASQMCFEDINLPGDTEGTIRIASDTSGAVRPITQLIGRIGRSLNFKHCV